jgi:hypothetical protein
LTLNEAVKSAILLAEQANGVLEPVTVGFDCREAAYFHGQGQGKAHDVER